MTYLCMVKELIIMPSNDGLLSLKYIRSWPIYDLSTTLFNNTSTATACSSGIFSLVHTDMKYKLMGIPGSSDESKHDYF